MLAKVYVLHAISALHVGTGQGVGVIDLPIAREQATNVPQVPGASVKGVLRDGGRAVDPAKTVAVFGPDADAAENYAGAIRVSDARLLLMPVRSFLGTFAWVTSPFLLHRFVRDWRVAGGPQLPAVPAVTEVQTCKVPAQPASALTLGQPPKVQVYFEDLDLDAMRDADLENWAHELAALCFPSPADAAWTDLFKARFCLVHDDVMNFLLETATEVVTRVRLQEGDKTVAKGALWLEEALPAESILYGLLGAARVKTKTGMTEPKDVFAFVDQLSARPLQVGGKTTVGRGLCRFTLC